MRLKRVISIGCALALFGFSAHAGVINPNTIVVTATRTEANALTTPSQVNVITSKQMKEEGVTFVQNALKYVPGVTVYSNGAFGGLTNVSIRGLPTYYTKTLIDGIDVSDPSQPQPYFNYANLMSSDIQRIEIVQGAQSGLYGSNAIGGVINIITKRGVGKPYFKYTQQLGSFHTFGETAESGGQIKHLSFYVNVSRFDTDGISKTDVYNFTTHSYSRGGEKDAYHNTSLSSRIEYELQQGMKLGLVTKLYKTRNFLDEYDSTLHMSYDNYKYNLTPQGKSYREIDKFGLAKLYFSAPINSKLSLNLNAFFVQNLRYYYNDYYYSYYNDYFKGKRWGSNYTINYKTKTTTLSVGLTQQMEKYKDSYKFKKLRYNYAGFSEIIQKISNLTLQGVAREDKYKTFGKHFTYKIGTSLLISQTNTILKANYGTGFMAPSIYELYGPYVGNKNLKPEKSKTWSFGLQQILINGKLYINTLYFKNIVKNRIEYSFSKWKYEQVEGKTVSHGFELGLKTSPTKSIETGINYTYTRSINPNTGEQSARIPLRVYTGYITVKILNNKLIGTLDGRYIGKRYDDSYHTHQTGKYAVFDFTALYKPIKRLELTLTIKNIFNRFYEEVYGYSTLPRSVFATVSYKF